MNNITYNLFIITDHKSENIKEEGYTILFFPDWDWLTSEDNDIIRLTHHSRYFKKKGSTNYAK